MRTSLRILVILLLVGGAWIYIATVVVNRQVEERATKAAVEADRGSKELKGSGLAGSLTTRYEQSKVYYRFALDGEPYPVGKQGFALLNAAGGKLTEEAFAHRDFTKRANEWVVECVMTKHINPKSYEAATDWMIGVIPP